MIIAISQDPSESEISSFSKDLNESRKISKDLKKSPYALHFPVPVRSKFRSKFQRIENGNSQPTAFKTAQLSPIVFPPPNLLLALKDNHHFAHRLPLAAVEQH
ncbi:uncharacterized protein ASCRUDRAFT_9116 [Ascoidea rubescens DSM 1968]|uniref:Uncharacterized protein n=1 Tax=Ascoidea rubescens DSM 1968 TaxID=1344418 RepID=A0A1D2VDY5_9ASCO|nr:hypothetical protein ASCRUDRAFT_9116 [Ascoidea rubescens DSM 1968]ODV59918.1 hypothetical protein ASCRUDRAFT_9116 [Ascoidea rubescens DSM 1968]